MDPTEELRSGKIPEEIAEDSLQFGEELQTLMSVPPESGNSFTALLELPPNQAVKLLHTPDKIAEKIAEHPNVYPYAPMFPSNSALIDRASKFSVFATENSPEKSVPVKQEPVESDSHRNSSPGMSDSVVPSSDHKSSKRKEREKKVGVCN